MLQVKRFICFVIDYGLFIALSYLFAMTFGESSGHNSYTLHGLYSFVPLAYWLLYFPVAEGLFGMTLTKFALSIKVVSASTGELLGLRKALLRRAFDAVDFALLLIPAIISVSRSPLNQRVGDRIVDALVVATPADADVAGSDL